MEETTALKEKFLDQGYFSGGGKRYDLGTKEASDYLLSGGLVDNEATVLSSESGRTNFDTKIKPSIDRANKNLASVLATAGLKPEKDESDLPEELRAELESTMTPEEKLFNAQQKSIDRQISTAEKTFKSLSSLASTSAAAQINALKGQWGIRRAEMEKANKGNLATWRQSFIRSGASEYSPGMSSDFLTAKEEEGMRKLEELDSDYNSKIASVNAALEEKKYGLAATLTKDINALEEKALEYTKELVNEAVKINKQTKSDLIISAAVNSGLTELQDVYDYVKENGSTASMKEVSDTLKLLSSGKDDWQEKLSGATRDFFILKEQGFLPPSISSLPENQQLFAYLKQEKAASTIGTGTGGSITLAEAKTLGLPISTVGMNEGEILASLEGSKPPAWFIEKIQKELRISLTPDAAAEAWEEYRNEIITAAEGDVVEDSTNYKKAKQYFSATYDGLTEDELDEIATQVETYVNGGMTYADAVTQTEKDLE